MSEAKKPGKVLFTVKLTYEELQAVRLCVRGELESLKEADWNSGLFDALQKASLKLQKARPA